jgi:hypothetical protein
MPDELVTIATYNNYLEAETYKIRLDSFGIPCNIVGGFAETMFGRHSTFGKQIRLEVPAEYAERALAVLQQKPDLKQDSNPETIGRIRKRPDSSLRKMNVKWKARQRNYVIVYIVASMVTGLAVFILSHIGGHR